MTSAGPARKPYRKAPPQHRETRHSLPVFREDLGVSAGPPTGSPGMAPPSPGTQHDPCQVICFRNHTVPVLQRTRFTNPYPVKRPPSPDGANVFSSSWSLASDSELDVSSLSSLDVTVLPPPRIFSHGAVGVSLPPRSHHPNMSRFLSRSEDLLPLSAEDERATSESSQQYLHGSSPFRSPERALAFKETTEIFAPPRGKRPQRDPRPQAHALPLPPKSILKQPSPPPCLPPADYLRKAKSVEMLGQGRGRGHKPKSTSLDREQGGLNQGKSSPALPYSVSSSSPADRGMHRLEEKVKFSQFLDEITYSVLSPANLHQLGGKKPEPARVGQKSSGQQNPKQNQGPAHEQKERKAGRRPWDDWVSQHQATRRDRENENENQPIPQHVPQRKDSPDREPEKWRTDPYREGARPKSEGHNYGRFGEGEGGDSRRTSESDWEDRSCRGTQQHHLQTHHQHKQHPHPHQHQHHTPSPYQPSLQQPHAQHHVPQHPISQTDFRTHSKDVAEKSPPLPPKLGSAASHPEAPKATVLEPSSVSFLSQLKVCERCHRVHKSTPSAAPVYPPACCFPLGEITESFSLTTPLCVTLRDITGAPYPPHPPHQLVSLGKIMGSFSWRCSLCLLHLSRSFPDVRTCSAACAHCCLRLL